jgi:hypothetical protein
LTATCAARIGPRAARRCLGFRVVAANPRRQRMSLEQRILPPPGFRRILCSAGFGDNALPRSERCSA